jgi:hypothetical protein
MMDVPGPPAGIELPGGRRNLAIPHPARDTERGAVRPPFFIHAMTGTDDP